MTSNSRTIALLAFVIAACAAGCSGGGGSGSPAPVHTSSATASPSVSASPAPVSAFTQFPVNASGGTASLSTSGYSGTLGYPSSTVASSTAAFTMANTYAGSVPSPQPSGTPVLYFTLQLTNGASFVGNGTSGFGVSQVGLPSSVRTSGTFTETFYDTTTGVEMGSATGSVSGTTITFGPVENMTSFTLTGGDLYLFEITEV